MTSKHHTVILDIETDGFLDVYEKVHCICTEWRADGVVVGTPSWRSAEAFIDECLLPLLRMGDTVELVGHNLTTFDMKVLEDFGFYGTIPGLTTFDTVIAARMAYPDRSTLPDSKMDADFKKKYSLHTLARWGFRLGCHKGDFGDTTDWSEWSQEMQDYCAQDVAVTSKLYDFIKDKVPKAALDRETVFAAELDEMMRRGVYVDQEKADNLMLEIAEKQMVQEAKCREIFPPRVIYYETKVRKEPRSMTVPFNPGSRDQIAWNLKEKYKWKPVEFTPTGKPKIDEKILENLDYPEAADLAEMMMLNKRASQLYDTDNSLLSHVAPDNGRIFGRINHIGTGTHRCSHFHPNLGQVPTPRKPYGLQFRGMIGPELDDWVFMGCDASGLELRVCAHYMEPFDGGAYIDHVLNGDIHTVNMNALGIDNRDKAKTFFYAMVYGAGVEKLGAIMSGDPSKKKENMKLGRHYKKKLLDGVEGFKDLVKAVVSKSESTGRVKLIDGRTIPTRSSHSALNTLFQGTGAVLMKEATNLVPITMETLYDSPPYKVTHRGERLPGDWGMVLHVHDEYQFEAQANIAERLGQVAADSFRAAGETLGMRCQLAGEYKIGTSWAETH